MVAPPNAGKKKAERKHSGNLRNARIGVLGEGFASARAHDELGPIHKSTEPTSVLARSPSDPVARQANQPPMAVVAATRSAPPQDDRKAGTTRVRRPISEPPLQIERERL